MEMTEYKRQVNTAWCKELIWWMRACAGVGGGGQE